MNTVRNSFFVLAAIASIWFFLQNTATLLIFLFQDFLSSDIGGFSILELYSSADDVLFITGSVLLVFSMFGILLVGYMFKGSFAGKILMFLSALFILLAIPSVIIDRYYIVQPDYLDLVRLLLVISVYFAFWRLPFDYIAKLGRGTGLLLLLSLIAFLILYLSSTLISMFAPAGIELIDALVLLNGLFIVGVLFSMVASIYQSVFFFKIGGRKNRMHQEKEQQQEEEVPTP